MSTGSRRRSSLARSCRAMPATARGLFERRALSCDATWSPRSMSSARQQDVARLPSFVANVLPATTGGRCTSSFQRASQPPFGKLRVGGVLCRWSGHVSRSAVVQQAFSQNGAHDARGGFPMPRQVKCTSTPRLPVPDLHTDLASRSTTDAVEPLGTRPAASKTRRATLRHRARLLVAGGFLAGSCALPTLRWWDGVAAVLRRLGRVELSWACWRSSP